jgi:hypothetical protein
MTRERRKLRTKINDANKQGIDCLIGMERNRNNSLKKFMEFKNRCTFKPTVPVQHTVRSVETVQLQGK